MKCLPEYLQKEESFVNFNNESSVSEVGKLLNEINQMYLLMYARVTRNLLLFLPYCGEEASSGITRKRLSMRPFVIIATESVVFRCSARN
ncbi:hypothetical protein CEXT_657201 [Caerostris extrusa]|uniref:Uncharacterized protein n=1 Tax=Caerostris extrusa TaxID=172846 RepID=A0AAV4PLD0_CAEEX|nr:hypothetical protein CEXT_657201 [Caerostris extrusa]